jgi:predicted porin
MKKTLLALSVLVASTAANAGIEIYNKDGATVNLGGDLEVVYKKSFDKDSTPEQQIQDADIKFDVRYAVNDEVTVGGYWEFQGDDSNTTDGSDAMMGDVYFAVYTANMGTLKVGDTCTIGDSMGVGSDYQFGLSKAIDSSAAFCGDEVIQYTLDKGMFYGGIAYRDNQTDAFVSGPEMVDMKVGFRAADFDVTAFYGDVASSEDDFAAFEVVYSGFDAITLEAGYYTTDGATSNDGGDTISAAAEYSVNAWSFAVGVSDRDFNDPSAEDSTVYFVNADYAVAPGTKLYAEIGGTDEDGKETGYAAGVKVEF